MGIDWDEHEELTLRARTIDARPAGTTLSLCERCRSGVLYRRNKPTGKGFQVGEAVTYCRTMSDIVPNDITGCSAFTDAKAMDIEDMQRMALKIDPRPPGVNDKSYM